MSFVAAEFELDWGEVSALENEFELPWEPTSAVESEAAFPWDATTPVDAESELPWGRSDAVDVETELPWGAAAAVDSECELPWGGATPTDVEFELPWAWAGIAESDFEFPWGAVSEGGRVFELPWTAWQRPEKEYNLPWINGPSYTMIENTVTLKRVSDDQNIRFLSASASIDIDSWAWQFRAELASRDDAGYVRITGSGPVEVLLTVNGYSWLFLVEDIQENYTYGQSSYIVTGRSPSAVLARPYAAQQTKTYTSITAAHSIVSEELVASGSGYSEIWGILNWVIGAGVYSVSDKTYMEIMIEIAKSIGGIIQTTPDSYSLEFMPRYPVSPKNWDGETPDETIYSYHILSQGVSWEPKPEYNYVLVSGTDNGVLVHVKRSGTSYDKPAPPILEDLILSQAVAQERGRNELDATGYNQSQYTMALPLPVSGTSPVLLLPTNLIEVHDVFETWRGMVRGVQVQAAKIGNGSSITQTIQVERHWTA